MLDLEVYDIVRIENATNESIYLESVNAIDNKKHIATTDHFRIKLDNEEVINDLGMYDNDEFEVRMVWRLNTKTKEYMLWDISDKEIQPIEEDKRCKEDVRPSDVDYDTYSKVRKERDELKEIVVEQAKAIYNLKQALKYKEN